jgi:hypothetical protein
MKAKELVKLLKEAGCILVRHGSRHDIWISPKTGNYNKKDFFSHRQDIIRIDGSQVLIQEKSIITRRRQGTDG